MLLASSSLNPPKHFCHWIDGACAEATIIVVKKKITKRLLLVVV
jgi:hypothetical protein